MGDGDATSGGNSPGSMDDLKKLETSLTSSMDTQMKELRDMMAQLLNANKSPTAPSLEFNASAALDGVGDGTKESPSKIDGTKESPPKIDGGKADYNAVPFVYSPDPPIPHLHINNRGDLPELNPSSFSIW